MLSAKEVEKNYQLSNCSAYRNLSSRFLEQLIIFMAKRKADYDDQATQPHALYLVCKSIPENCETSLIYPHSRELSISSEALTIETFFTTQFYSASETSIQLNERFRQKLKPNWQ